MSQSLTLSNFSDSQSQDPPRTCRKAWPATAHTHTRHTSSLGVIRNHDSQGNGQFEYGAWGVRHHRHPKASAAAKMTHGAFTVLLRACSLAALHCTRRPLLSLTHHCISPSRLLRLAREAAARLRRTVSGPGRSFDAPCKNPLVPSRVLHVLEQMLCWLQLFILHCGRMPGVAWRDVARTLALLCSVCELQ